MKYHVNTISILILIITINVLTADDLLFYSHDGNDNEVYRVDITNYAVTQLTDNTSNEGYAVISPDGKSIYYCSDESGIMNIWKMNVDGSEKERITNIQNWSSNIHLIIWMDVSPDNSKLVYSYKIADSGGYFALYTMNVDGSDVCEISPYISDFTYPTWSKDGTRILCSNNPPYNGGSNQILEMDPDGSNVKVIIPNSSNYPMYPEYSPNGDMITYSRAIGDIYICNLDGSGEINLTNTPGIEEYRSIWGDDNLIYFRKDSDVYQVKPDGTNYKFIYSHPYDIHAFNLIANNILQVEIDIKPGGENKINLRGRGVIPVAVLTTNDFNVQTIDVPSIFFGPGVAKPIHSGHMEDVDDDGDIDLMLHFRIKETGIDIGDQDVCLEGHTVEGKSITGCDSIRVIIGGKKKNINIDVANVFSIHQISPNPFNPTANISFEIPEDGFVDLTIYNLLGQEVIILLNQEMIAGQHNIRIDAADLSSGTYFAVLQSGSLRAVKKMILLK